MFVVNAIFLLKDSPNLGNYFYENQGFSLPKSILKLSVNSGLLVESQVKDPFKNGFYLTDAAKSNKDFLTVSGYL